MGWSKRGNGRQYDSLNGYAAIIGKEIGLVLDYTTRNRKCGQCDKGRSKTEHDCRLNFQGSAKAMEPDAAACLVTKSSILKENNVEVGVFIGDNDSSSICAVRNDSTHRIIKHSDMNHTSKGVKNMLYKIDKSKDPDKELNKEAIAYLHRCFTYAVMQNKGDTESMASTIKNIPFHAYNQHDYCGDWCGYIKDPEKYKHSSVVGGLKSPVLFQELKSVFQSLSNNAEKFSAGASSQANESLNRIMARKARKAICYSTSESADFRFACAIGQKNAGETYVQDTLKELLLSPGSRLTKHIERVKRSALRKFLQAKTPIFKLRRRNLQKSRTQLRNKKQVIEGDTYKTDIGLLEMPAIQNENESPNPPILTQETNDMNNHFQHEYSAVVFFDLETSGFQKNCDVLQISMKSGNSIFNEYINPIQKISSRVTQVNNLTNEEGELHLHGTKVSSLPLRIVLDMLLNYLRMFKKPCTLVAHNCALDAPRLMRIITETSLVEEFQSVISGFADTLPLFRQKFPNKRSKGGCTLTNLAAETLSITTVEAHNAINDVIIFEKLVLFHFTADEIVNSSKTFCEIFSLPKIAEENNNNFKTLSPIENVVSKSIRQKMASAGITYDLLINTYMTGEEEAVQLLQQKNNNGKPQVIKTKKILDNLLEHLKTSIYN